MMKLVEKQGTRSIRYVTPVAPGDETGLLTTVYEQLRQGFGAVVPPFSLHTPVPEIAAAIWSITRESLIAGQVPRGHKEAVSAAVSKTNACPYCVDAHTISLYAVSKPEVAAAISDGNFDRIQDASLRALVAWASACRAPDSEAVKSPPFTPEEAPEIIGTAVAFQHINRMANIFLDESPMPINPRSGLLKSAMKQMSGSMMRGIINSSLPAGDSLSLLEDAPLPEDMAWASSNPAVAGAFARAAAAIDQAAEGILPEAVRVLVQDCIRAWRGEEMGLSRSWVETAVAGLNEADKPVARLALLTALASYKVDEQIVSDVRVRYPADADLIAIIAWASFTTSRRVGSWLTVPTTERAVT
jgi:AhpD family alkylhydroperoxidase